MLAGLKSKLGAYALGASVFVATGLLTNPARAVSAGLARKCDALTAKAFPPREAGNPAAGSARGGGQSERNYFNQCIANGSKTDGARR
jgi:hypothetical protein